MMFISKFELYFYATVIAVLFAKAGYDLATRIARAHSYTEKFSLDHFKDDPEKVRKIKADYVQSEAIDQVLISCFQIGITITLIFTVGWWLPVTIAAFIQGALFIFIFWIGSVLWKWRNPI